MQTEFTCGIYMATYGGIAAPVWKVTANNYEIAYIGEPGDTIKFTPTNPYLTENCLIEIAVLMNNIKRQYKQLQTT